MNSRTLAPLAAIVLAFIVAIVETAGGAPPTPTGTIKVRNSSPFMLVVFVDLSAANMKNLSAGQVLTAELQANFLALGGVFIEPGSTRTFSNVQAGLRLRPGIHSLAAEFLDTRIVSDDVSIAAVVPVTGVAGVTTTPVYKGLTTTVTYKGTPAAPPSASVSRFGRL
jgi:hypothetical protein